MENFPKAVIVCLYLLKTQNEAPIEGACGG